MYFELLENIAQNNGMRDISPYTKLLLGLGCILIVITSPGYIVPLFIAITLSVCILGIGKIPVRLYLTLLSIPLGFAIASVIVIVLVTGGGMTVFSLQVTNWLSLSVTVESLNEGFFVFCRIFGGMCALFFISLTTPMTDLFSVMKRCYIPMVLIDLAMLIYRFIFIFMEKAELIYRAQVMRLGYSTYREAIHTSGDLAGALFLASWNAGEDLIKAMDCRCYSGQFALLSKETPLQIRSVLLICIFLGFCCTLEVITADYTIIPVSI
ncbi:MAG: cobalt ECF transporter T component CbiQ [Methanospirillaceae archaeon]|nr:cobalt ECF transporter T component CbiQ [Methanospirillaceae archaeon]